MNYKLTALTPMLVGDGRELSPIDYMVWKDQVNVLDQNRIFKLLARGPRLESYLVQLRKATKLDFASWGGFRAKFLPAPHSFRNRRSRLHLEQRSAGSSLHPHIRRQLPRRLSARLRSQRRLAQRLSIFSLVRRRYRARRGRNGRRSSSAPHRRKLGSARPSLANAGVRRGR